jgi:hypothetical protein
MASSQLLVWEESRRLMPSDVESSNLESCRFARFGRRACGGGDGDSNIAVERIRRFEHSSKPNSLTASPRRRRQSEGFKKLWKELFRRKKDEFALSPEGAGGPRNCGSTNLTVRADRSRLDTCQ